MSERNFILRNDFVRKGVMAFIEKLAFDHEIIIKPWHPKRSITANARLWKLHELAAAVTGYSKEEMHEHALCRHFGFSERKVTDPLTGEIQTKRDPLKRSSDCDSPTFRQFMEETESWYIADFGVFLDQEPPSKQEAVG